MNTKCKHLKEIRDVQPSGTGCKECLEIGDSWVHLRICLTCGHVGCCDDSKNKHATRHFHQIHHPIIQSFEPGEDWRWCYVDEILLDWERSFNRCSAGVPPACRVAQRASIVFNEGGISMSIKPGWEGRYFEDFTVGDVYRCRLGRTVTEADNIWFTLLTNNTNQIHFNNEYGKRTEFGKCLINSALTLAIVAGMGVADVSENGFALGWDGIKLPHPLFAGDTLYSESEVLEKRESKSKPQWGIVKVRTRGVQQEGKIVIDYVRSVMVWKREHAPKQDLFPKIREDGQVIV